MDKQLIERIITQLEKRAVDLRYVAIVADVDKEDKVLAVRNMVECKELIKELTAILGEDLGN